MSLETTAVARRDFANGIVKPQLVVAAPTLPPGPTAVTVTQGGVTVLAVPAEQFTLLQPAIRLAERSGKTIATCYQAAVGSDGTVYFPLSIAGIAERMLFQLRRAGLAVRANQPYGGVGAAICTSLRKELGARYAGIQLETSHAVTNSAGGCAKVAAALVPFLETL